MSDSDDKPRRDGERGPLPRTNRPRPEASSRRGRAERAEDVPQEAKITLRAEDVLRQSGAVRVELTPTEGSPGTDPPRSVVGRPDAHTDQLVERPTQLAVGDRRPTEREPTPNLKHVALQRADGTLAPEEEAGPGSTYIGSLIDGRYRIEGILGRGGMGVVYRARHGVIDKLVAIKILLATEDSDVVDRFVNEARAATAIGNAHIVDTVDFGALPDGSTYFVMEYLEGETLDRRIKRDGFVPIPRTLSIVRQIAEGMGAAHRAGIVHRDLKPENIFLTPPDDGTDADFVKLLDFGIAKMANAQNRITRAGTIFGTPHYMSPEQASGSEVDPRTDVYSTGIILYEMLSGRVPFDAENPMGLLTQHMYSDPVPLTRLESPAQVVSSSLDAVVLKCLSKKPEDRYATMADLAADAVRIERNEPPIALAELILRAERDHDETLVRAAKRELAPSTRGRLLPWAAALAVLGALVVGAFVVSGPRVTAPAVPTVGTLHRPMPGSPGGSPVRQTVALVFSPIDAEVYRGNKSLGGMPVNIPLAPGESADVEIRRDGFYPEKIHVDGSRSVVVARLTAIPGVEPRIPVPRGEPPEAFARGADPEARFAPAVPSALAAAAAAMRVDAGAPRPIPSPLAEAKGTAPSPSAPPTASAPPEGPTAEVAPMAPPAPPTPGPIEPVAPTPPPAAGSASP